LIQWDEQLFVGGDHIPENLPGLNDVGKKLPFYFNWHTLRIIPSQTLPVTAKTAQLRIKR